MKRNRCLLSLLGGLAIGSAGVATQDPPPIDWALYGTGDPMIDVAADLEEAPELTVYDFLTKVVMEHIDAEGQYVLLLWDGEFHLLLDGVWVGDLETGEDEYGRPTFSGSYDSEEVPGVDGFVDVSADGLLIVDLTRPYKADSRFEITDGLVSAEGQCKCPSVAGALCGKIDCDSGKVCFDPQKCTWYKDGISIDPH